MFCPQCGTRCTDEASFCGNCGTPLPKSRPCEEPAPQQPSASVPVSEFDRAVSKAVEERSTTKPVCEEGVLFTNLDALAERLNTQRDILKKILLAYAEASASRGIHYRLLDVSDYLFVGTSLRKVSLKPADSWLKHVELLDNWYRHYRPHESGEQKSCYLFILGGHDIIPMPVMEHYMRHQENFHDRDIETDLPYAYLLDRDRCPMFSSGRVFEYEQYFHVGRLPFGADASLDDLTGYIRSMAHLPNGLPVGSYFALANNLWKDESVAVCSPLREHGLTQSTASYEEYEMAGYPLVENGLFISAPVTTRCIDELFTPNASVYYFNLHGSSAPESRGFVGEAQQREYCLAIEPEQLAAIASPNLFVTEACYGARFIDYDRRHSMLLTALGNRTLIYLGSSRIAFGSRSASQIDYADRMAMSFLAGFLDGHSAGEALFLARHDFFGAAKGNIDPIQMTTIAEFNLFGDPYAFVERPAGCRLSAKRAAISETSVHCATASECVYSKSAEARPASMLDEVRNAVDANLRFIRETVNRELYERLGLEPRHLQAVYRNRFDDGTDSYTFEYANPEDPFDYHCAFTDLNGRVERVASAKSANNTNLKTNLL